MTIKSSFALFGTMLILAACGGPPVSSSSSSPSSSSSKAPSPHSATLPHNALPSPEPTLQDETAQADIWFVGDSVESTSEVREDAIESLALTDPAALADSLPLLLTDPDTEVRLATVEALLDAKLTRDTAVEFLEMARLDPEPSVRMAAEDALEELIGLYEP